MSPTRKQNEKQYTKELSFTPINILLNELVPALLGRHAVSQDLSTPVSNNRRPTTFLPPPIEPPPLQRGSYSKHAVYT